MKTKKRLISIVGAFVMTLALCGTSVFAANTNFSSPGDGDYVLLNKPVDIQYSVNYSASNGQEYCRINLEKPNGEKEELTTQDDVSEVQTSFTPSAEGTYKITAECGMYLTWNFGGTSYGGITRFDPDVTETISVKAVKAFPKKANPLKIKAKTAKVKYKKLKKKNQTLAVSKVITFTKKGQGKVTYTKASGNKKITINKKTGKITIKKGLKKGTYKVKVKVKAAGNAEYNTATKTATFKIKIK